MLEKPIYGGRFGPPPDLGKTMLLCDFQAKLKRLHPDLYVKTDERTKNGANFWISGIYLKARRQPSKIKADRNLVHAQHEKYLNALESGELDKFVSGVCLNHIPEYDIFDFALTRILAPGWRKLAMRFVAVNICTLERAQKVFNCPSLGESDYDNMNFFKRFNWTKKGTQGDQNA